MGVHLCVTDDLITTTALSNALHAAAIYTRGASAQQFDVTATSATVFFATVYQLHNSYAEIKL
jgi:hypothetical protein